MSRIEQSGSGAIGKRKQLEVRFSGSVPHRELRAHCQPSCFFAWRQPIEAGAPVRSFLPPRSPRGTTWRARPQRPCPLAGRASIVEPGLRCPGFSFPSWETDVEVLVSQRERATLRVLVRARVAAPGALARLAARTQQGSTAFCSAARRLLRRKELLRLAERWERPCGENEPRRAALPTAFGHGIGQRHRRQPRSGRHWLPRWVRTLRTGGRIREPGGSGTGRRHTSPGRRSGGEPTRIYSSK